MGEVIARHMNSEGTAWPGYKLIAEEAGVSQKSVQNAVKVLVDGDPSRDLVPLFTRKRRRDEHGKPKSYEYRLVEDPEALMAARVEGAAQMSRISEMLKGGTEVIKARLDEQTEAEGKALRMRELQLQKSRLSGEITEAEYQQQVKPIQAKRLRLARAVARSTRSAEA